MLPSIINQLGPQDGGMNWEALTAAMRQQDPSLPAAAAGGDGDDDSDDDIPDLVENFDEAADE